MLDKNVIAKIEKILGYRFEDEALLSQAFTRPSFRMEHPEARDNEVLDVFGGMILSFAVCGILLDRYTFRDDSGLVSYMQEDAFMNMHTNCVRPAFLAEKVKALGLDAYIITGDGEELTDEIRAKLFESLVAAVYIDAEKDMALAGSLATRLLGL